MLRFIMKMKSFLMLFFVLVFFVNVGASYAQDESQLDKIFADFEQGIKSKNIELFFNHLDSEIYISLAKSVSGYFSANQSFHLLQKYIDEINPTTFKLTRQQNQSPYPYSTGVLYYNRSGIHGNYQVYMSVKKEERGWKITQITFN